jgi:hypothetical protein
MTEDELNACVGGCGGNSLWLFVASMVAIVVVMSYANRKGW